MATVGEEQDGFDEVRFVLFDQHSYDTFAARM